MLLQNKPNESLMDISKLTSAATPEDRATAAADFGAKVLAAGPVRLFTSILFLLTPPPRVPAAEHD